MGVSEPPQGDVVQLYVKAGVDGQRLGACPFCQRVHMVVFIKAQKGLLNYKLVLSNPAKPPEELKRLGLKHLPAIIHGDEGFDTEDDIVEYLDTKFPGGDLSYDNSDADIACNNFFSKFCFFIKAVNQDSSKLNHALEQLNSFLEGTSPPSSLATNSPPPTSPTSPIPAAFSNTSSPSLKPTFPSFPSPPTPPGSVSSNATSPRSASPTNCPPPSSVSSPPCLFPSSTTQWPVMASKAIKLTHPVEEEATCQWLCGASLSHLDCEVLPKLQHVRVACLALKQYQIPRHLLGVWRYLHSAYSHPAFVDTCPCDQEIILHWHDRPETKKLSHKKHAEISKEKPKFSLDVPAHASMVTVMEVQ